MLPKTQSSLVSSPWQWRCAYTQCPGTPSTCPSFSHGPCLTLLRMPEGGRRQEALSLQAVRQMVTPGAKVTIATLSAFSGLNWILRFSCMQHTVGPWDTPVVKCCILCISNVQVLATTRTFAPAPSADSLRTPLSGTGQVQRIVFCFSSNSEGSD